MAAFTSTHVVTGSSHALALIPFPLTFPLPFLLPVLPLPLSLPLHAGRRHC